MIGRVISHYRVISQLGNGSMGAVYKAQDLKLDRTVAIKFTSRAVADNREQRLRFEREARTASLLDHPNICTIHEFGETDDGELFLAMSYCPGEDLRSRLTRGPFPLKEAVNVAEQVLLGLAKAHSLGIVHRDIKPANIMLMPDGVVKIVDFGLAKFPRDISLTSPGGVVGTVPYMSPEQLRGDPLDGRTDLWSWAVMLYEMLAGERPFDAPTGSEFDPRHRRYRSTLAGLASARCAAGAGLHRPSGAAEESRPAPQKYRSGSRSSALALAADRPYTAVRRNPPAACLGGGSALPQPQP